MFIIGVNWGFRQTEIRSALTVIFYTPTPLLIINYSRLTIHEAQSGQPPFSKGPVHLHPPPPPTYTTSDILALM